MRAERRQNLPILELARIGLEGHKLDHDTYKHLTTLSTGSMLLLATFLEKVFQKPSWKFLVTAAFVSFIVSVGASVWAMSVSSFQIHALAGAAFRVGIIDREVPEREFDVKFERNIVLTTVVTMTLAWGGFLVGIGALAVFTIKNLG